VRRTGAAIATFQNGVVFGNGALAFNGVSSSDVSHTCGLASGVGNFSADPQFVDGPNGDLRLLATSPCLEAADVSVATLVLMDHDARPRLLDGAFSGTFGADMGAYERAPYELDVIGRAHSGTTMHFVVNGEAGTALLALGAFSGTEIVAPYGVLLADPAFALLPLATLPVGAALSIAIPDVSAFEGVSVGVQAFGASSINPGFGALTRVHRAVLDG
jgi:hypothetical protein